VDNLNIERKKDKKDFREVYKWIIPKKEISG
jgi:hypothetical protein